MKNPYLRLIRFDKPIGTLLLLWPTLWALVIAGSGHPPLYAVIVFALGVFLTRSAGCAINDYADAEFDKHVERTKHRPVTSGEITKKQALYMFIGLSLIAFFMAYTTLKVTTLLLSIPALLIFVSYPFTKRFFAIPQAYLGIAYSFGILMAFVEVKGTLTVTAWILFVANFFWVIGYDTIYAMVDIEDDLKLGVKTSAITFGDYVVPVISCCYMAFAILLAYVAHLLHFGILFWIFWLYAVLILAHQVRSARKKVKLFQMFLLNNRVGYILFIAILLGYLSQLHLI
ncbi:MAG: 4-hydroxybenzoate octaprenyltransferase [Burkholderiales bacterium]|jgi:4-hydroxybenzoate polyprenyltransferase|nr:4-hydroxybenzoate octaprenyltransferase [Burkholderiales bacterium]